MKITLVNTYTHTHRHYEDLIKAPLIWSSLIYSRLVPRVAIISAATGHSVQSPFLLIVMSYNCIDTFTILTQEKEMYIFFAVWQSFFLPSKMHFFCWISLAFQILSDFQRFFVSLDIFFSKLWHLKNVWLGSWLWWIW